jgi:two-component system sensor histidine kinase ChvG
MSLLTPADPPALAKPALAQPALSHAALPGPRPGAAKASRAEASPRGRGLSPLTARILAVNLLPLLILVAGVLYLGRYQDQLEQAELESLALQAGIFAGALAEGAVPPSADEFNEPSTEIEPELARQMVRRLVETTDTRTRLYGTNGNLIADSRVVGGLKSGGGGGRVEIEELAPPPDSNKLTQLGLQIYELLINTMPGRDKLAGCPA